MALNKDFEQNLNKVLKAVGLKPIERKEDVEALESVLKGFFRSIKTAVATANAAEHRSALEKTANETPPPKSGNGGRKSGNGGDQAYGNKYGFWDQAEEDQRQVILAESKKLLASIPADQKQDFYDWKKKNKMGIFDDMFLSRLRIAIKEWRAWIKENVDGSGAPANVAAGGDGEEDEDTPW